jgi:hypothetical protein
MLCLITSHGSISLRQYSHSSHCQYSFDTAQLHVGPVNGTVDGMRQLCQRRELYYISRSMRVI